ncbi:hypothetical protein H257_13263 [Aphanomyces astaci]|uniref:Uncharacterized protein n=1 Tax=Aphanomyces astaci TaxID=112090 RepID=W4FV31_APHAT|nr:hypothetical protein H257_13263 [Aphanomyces astaci]ETV71365.1 hypothetical protein H257_13263 [Aphanomyces astaci]|eukprot:XP_009839030.1 hypothetical protein H257_13263 [Aphanomyces astaci]
MVHRGRVGPIVDTTSRTTSTTIHDTAVFVHHHHDSRRVAGGKCHRRLHPLGRRMRVGLVHVVRPRLEGGRDTGPPIGAIERIHEERNRSCAVIVDYKARPARGLLLPTWHVDGWTRWRQSNNRMMTQLFLLWLRWSGGLVMMMVDVVHRWVPMNMPNSSVVLILRSAPIQARQQVTTIPARAMDVGVALPSRRADRFRRDGMGGVVDGSGHARYAYSGVISVYDKAPAASMAHSLAARVARVFGADT